MSVPPSWNLSCNALIGFSRYPSTSSTSDVRFKRVSNQGGYVPTFSDTFEKSLRKKTLHSLIHGIIVAAPSSPSIFMDFWSWWFPSCAQILAIFEHWKAMCFFFAASKLQAIPSGLQSDDDSLGRRFWDSQMTSNHYKSQIKGMTRHGTDPDGKTRHLHWGHVMTTTPWW